MRARDQEPLGVLVVGAGQRGYAYSTALQAEPLAQRCQVIAVAEPDEARRRHFAQVLEVNTAHTFADWREIVSDPEKRVALKFHAVMICTLDWQHTEPAVAFAKLGYHFLLEKPLSTTWSSTQELVQSLRTSSVLFAVGHVLRYSPFYILLKRLISDPKLVGQITNIQHTERVGWWHFAHSYVRGNWRSTGLNDKGEKVDIGAPSLLTKCCHDTDLLFWLLDNKPATEMQNTVSGTIPEPQRTTRLNDSLERAVSEELPEVGSFSTKNETPISIFSTGTRSVFLHTNKPSNAGSHCLSCPIEPHCLFSAKRIYINHGLHNPHRTTKWPASVIVPDIEDYAADKREAAVLAALSPSSDSNYGKCVWSIPDNDVCENQTVTFEFPSGTIASLNMVAMAGAISKRQTAIYGTRGELHADSLTKEITIHTYADDTQRSYQPQSQGSGNAASSHGGGDFGLIAAFVDALWAVEREGCNVGDAQSRFLGIDYDEIEKGHRGVWVAEKSRVSGQALPWGTEL